MHSSGYRRLANQPFVTYGLLGITVLVYLLETLAGGSTDTMVLLQFGARYNLLIEAGQWWRLITPIFVHIGLMHIVVNGVTLYYLGMLTERIFGHWRFFVVYLLSGITGNLASAVFNSTGLAAGASTSLFGLMGAFLMLYDTFRDDPQITALAKQFILLAGLNLVMDLFMSGVDIWGHIGGFVGGFLIATVLGVPRFASSRVRQVIAAAVLVVASGAMMWAAFGAF